MCFSLKTYRGSHGTVLRSSHSNVCLFTVKALPELLLFFPPPAGLTGAHPAVPSVHSCLFPLVCLRTLTELSDNSALSVLHTVRIGQHDGTHPIGLRYNSVVK